MKDILVNITPQKSHYYSCVNLLDSLKKRGYNILCLVHENNSLQDFIKKLGYNPLVNRIKYNKYLYIDVKDIRNWELLSKELNADSDSFPYILLNKNTQKSANEKDNHQSVIAAFNALIDDKNLYASVKEQVHISSKTYTSKRTYLTDNHQRLFHIDESLNIRLFNRILLSEILFPQILKSPSFFKLYSSDNIFYRMVRKAIEGFYLMKIQFEQYCQNIKNFTPDGETFQMIHKIDPAICIHETFSTDSLYFTKELNIPSVHISLSLFTDQVKNIPPVNSDFIPDNSMKSRIIVRFLWLRLKLKNFSIMSYLTRIVIANSAQKEILRNYSRIKKKYRHLVYNKTFGIGMKDVHEIIPSIQEIEFPLGNRNIQNIHFTGFNIHHDLSSSGFNWNDIKKNDYLVFCSFGLSFTTDRGQIIGLYKTIIDIFQNKSNYTLILSLSNLIPIEYFKTTAKNIHVYNWVPQPEVLSKSDLMITHGGTKSIQECIAAKVPMLVFPLFTDQFGNSSKVVYHKLGIRCDLRNYSRAELENKISVLLTDSFKGNVTKMNGCQKNYSVSMSADIVESIIDKKI